MNDLSDQFSLWLRSMGKSKKTAASYVGAIKGSISTWASNADIIHQNIITIKSFTLIDRAIEKLVKDPVFIEKNTVGKNMYSCALNSYKEFLSVTCQVDVSEDIEEIIGNDAIKTTDKTLLVNTRLGQGKFREKLIDYWQGCAVTGYKATQFLVASHIKPWRESNHIERLDQFNGFLLLPNLDKAFDLGYITFTDKGSIRTSEFIESPEMLGINKNMKIDLENKHQDYLAYHRENVFGKSI